MAPFPLRALFVTGAALLVLCPSSAPALSYLGEGIGDDCLVDMVDGERIYQMARQIEELGLEHPAFRSAGSVGAREAGDWIEQAFRERGLDAWHEGFGFTTWDLPSAPTLTVAQEGEQGEYVLEMTSFMCEHLNYPTPPGGVLAEMVALPLPSAPGPEAVARSTLRPSSEGIDISGKIVLTGIEVKWNPLWYQDLIAKMTEQPPSGLVYAWWYA